MNGLKFIQRFKGETEMKEKLIDVCFAVALGLVFAGFALAYFDILTY
jgi:hypothetical protein